MTAVVEVRDVFRVHPSPEGGVAALQGLSLTVAEGEVCVVLGPSGSGKTTLLRILAGFDRPSAGSVRVAGHDLAALSRRGLARLRARELGYADQHYWRALAGELTARQLVGVQLGLAGATRAERDARADELLERIGLSGRRDAKPAELSGGEQQRIALAAALAHRPRLLIADEPTGELDAANARALFALIAELARDEGATALLVSHDPASTGVADRVVRIRDGRVSEEQVAGTEAETIVVGRGGWLRLPEDALRAAGIGDRATARTADGHVLLSPVTDGARDRDERRESDSQLLGAGARDAEAGAARGTGAGAVIEARGLTRRFGAATPFAGLDAAFAGGRLSAVTGPSGSGKTTLLHLLAGLDLPDEGEVVVDGVLLSALDRDGRAALRRDRIGFVSQAPGLVPFLGARRNVELALELRGLDHRAPGNRGRVEEALAAVGLAEHAERRVDRLSAGQRGRVAVARALAARPLVLLADEPTARLDAEHALELGALLARLARETGAAVVCATHDPLLVEQADAELSLRSGTWQS
jgi:ABC-type lipoprotein export system ATPase subunit